ncbi:MAG: hypothetical protein RIE84_11310 [Parvibaculum sp.]|uniref:hypothetical protein n=1 Tax=Parvibaculum sp. TaxID=2024848 RepID=UPI0032EF48CE
MTTTASLAASFEDAATDSGTYVPAESARADWEAFGPDAFRYGTAAEALKSGAASGQSGHAVTAQADGRLSADEKEKKRDRAGTDRMLLQVQLQEQYDALVERQNWLADEMDRLKTEIGGIDKQIAFLRQFQDEDDLVDENGELKPDVERYLQEKGRDPSQMTQHEIWLLMQQHEADNHNRREDTVDEYNAHAEEMKANKAKLDKIENEAEENGLKLDSTARKDIDAVKSLVREHAPQDAGDMELMSWADGEKAGAKTASNEVRIEAATEKGGQSFNMGGL